MPTMKIIYQLHAAKKTLNERNFACRQQDSIHEPKCASLSYQATL